jgi:HK97 gp10 family phage protein
MPPITQSGDVVKVSFSWKGIRDMKAELRAMPDKLRARGVRQGVTAAAKTIRDQIRSNAPVESTSLRQAIDYKIARYRSRRRADAVTFVGVIGPDKKYRLAARSSWDRIVTRRVRPVWYAHLVEGGVRPHHTLQNRGGLVVAVPHPGVRATHFMKRGVQMASGRAAQKMEEAIARAIARYQKGKR